MKYLVSLKQSSTVINELDNLLNMIEQSNMNGLLKLNLLSKFSEEKNLDNTQQTFESANALNLMSENEYLPENISKTINNTDKEREEEFFRVVSGMIP